MNLEKRSKLIIMLGAVLFLFAGLLLAQETPSTVSGNEPTEQNSTAPAVVADSDDSAADHKYAMLMAGLTIFVISISILSCLSG